MTKSSTKKTQEKQSPTRQIDALRRSYDYCSPSPSQIAYMLMPIAEKLEELERKIDQIIPK